MSPLDPADPAAQLDLLDPTPLVRDTERRAIATAAGIASLLRQEKERPNTTTAYAQDWARWREFVATTTAAGRPVDLYPPKGAPDPPVTPNQADALLVFARWLAQGGHTALGNTVSPHAPESIRRRLTGVLAGWRSGGLDYTRGVTKDAREWVSWYADRLVAANRPTGRGKAPALELTGEPDDQTIAVAEATELAVRAGKLHPLAARRDMALILVGMAVAGRSAEASFIEVSDITSGENDGLYVHIRESKKGHRQPYIRRGGRTATCPVLAWQRWMTASGIVTGPAFRQVRYGRVLAAGLSPEGCSDVVTRAGKRAGIPNLTFHSLRAGFATAAALAKKPKSEIADQGGWDRNSPVLEEYIRAVKVYQEAVTEGIGF